MRKTELPNCPQWLLDADTENEDVDFDTWGILIWKSGNFLGGDFRGGDFWGGDFRGEKITRKPISIYGLAWPVLIVQTQLQIGCQTHPHAEWEKFSDDEISQMAGGALAFWKENKDFLLSICKHEREAK